MGGQEHQQVLHSSLKPYSAGSRSTCKKWGMQPEDPVAGPAAHALCSNDNDDMVLLIGTQLDGGSVDCYQLFENTMVGASRQALCSLVNNEQHTLLSSSRNIFLDAYHASLAACVISASSICTVDTQHTVCMRRWRAHPQAQVHTSTAANSAIQSTRIG
eukprot:GHRQ01029512.1.p1 GENE.GHRQ01029512.1~~GHRQ01029512.1.p1  ORF type:complete len:159 (+),score=31.61 GHRQ01029512.1:103-579(+)